MYQEDAILVNQALQGDKDSFGKLIEKYQHQIYGLAFHKAQNFADAEDIAQQVFLVAYENLGNLREPAKFAPWLKGIAKNLIKMCGRQRKRTESLENFTEGEMDDLIAPMSPPTPEEHCEKREIQEKVMGAISALAEPNRLVVSLYYIDGLSYSDISEFLEIPVGTVRSRLHRAKTQLKGEMIGMVKEMFEEHLLPKEFSQKVLRQTEEVLLDEDGTISSKFAQSVLENFPDGLPDGYQKVYDISVPEGGAAVICPYTIPVTHNYITEHSLSSHSNPAWTSEERETLQSLANEMNEPNTTRERKKEILFEMNEIFRRHIPEMDEILKRPAEDFQ